MYQFSRSIYRELAPVVVASRGEDVTLARARLLRACERSVERLALDRHYFARPTRTLFREVRGLFPIGEQTRALSVIEAHMELARQYVEAQAREGVTFDGSPLCCHASTRRGTPCQRVPLPASRYCPSHKHLEEEIEVVAA